MVGRLKIAFVECDLQADVLVSSEGVEVVDGGEVARWLAIAVCASAFVECSNVIEQFVRIGDTMTQGSNGFVNVVLRDPEGRDFIASALGDRWNGQLVL